MPNATSTHDQQATPSSERPAEAAVTAFGNVESKIPGRMRVRLKPELRTPEVMAKIQANLSRHAQVTDVTINQRTGSVTMQHAKRQDGHTVFAEAIEEAEFLTEAVLDLPDTAEGEEGGDRFAKLDQQLADLAYKVEYAVWQKTRLRFRGQVIAGTIAGAGIAQIAIFGISLEMLPGPLLLWIAWDIYHRVANEPPFPDEVTAEAPQQDAPESPGAPDLAAAT
jgi:hypothetical protein